MGVSKEFALDEVNKFNIYYESLDKKAKENWGRKASLDTYKCCNYPKFRPFRSGDCPEISTINPVICEELYENFGRSSRK